VALTRRALVGAGLGAALLARLGALPQRLEDAARSAPKPRAQVAVQAAQALEQERTHPADAGGVEDRRAFGLTGRDHATGPPVPPRVRRV
jgi:hypothetical protein